MKTYREEMVIDVDAQRAWLALQNMQDWLPLLSTNTNISYEHDGTFFFAGRTYDITTKEGVVMHCRITEVNEPARYIKIRAEHKPLVSQLTCSVEPLEKNTCRLVRTQSYPGFFGWLFTKFFNKREAGETGEYLEVWGKYAKNHMETQ